MKSWLKLSLNHTLALTSDSCSHEEVSQHEKTKGELKKTKRKLKTTKDKLKKNGNKKRKLKAQLVEACKELVDFKSKLGKTKSTNQSKDQLAEAHKELVDLIGSTNNNLEQAIARINDITVSATKSSQNVRPPLSCPCCEQRRHRYGEDDINLDDLEDPDGMGKPGCVHELRNTWRIKSTETTLMGESRSVLRKLVQAAHHL